MFGIWVNDGRQIMFCTTLMTSWRRGNLEEAVVQKRCRTAGNMFKETGIKKPSSKPDFSILLSARRWKKKKHPKTSEWMEEDPKHRKIHRKFDTDPDFVSGSRRKWIISQDQVFQIWKLKILNFTDIFIISYRKRNRTARSVKFTTESKNTIRCCLSDTLKVVQVLCLRGLKTWQFSCSKMNLEEAMST